MKDRRWNLGRISCILGCLVREHVIISPLFGEVDATVNANI
jgi:hypothetical protein